MAGIYIHVPFCKVKCHYCDFHFSVQLKNRDAMVSAMLAELDLRKGFFGNEAVETIYFGGGTPSVLSENALENIIQKIKNNFDVTSDCEVTLECNPDDLSENKLKALRQLGINRLSIGIQSFDNKVLQFMNRAHDSSQAINALELAHKTGFDNITIDLIYGVPESNLKTWDKELELLSSFNVPHLSAYCLTIEENTVFGNWHEKGKIKLPTDEISLAQFERLIEFAGDHGMEQYEISNFARPGFISKHNSAYWLGKKYLGIGPSAHGYDQKKRIWNVANNMRYMKAIEKREVYYEEETLSQTDRFNEYILTRLRTKWGIVKEDLKQISSKFAQQIEPILEGYVRSEKIQEAKGVYTLTQEGKFIADAISSDLFQ